MFNSDVIRFVYRTIKFIFFVLLLLLLGILLPPTPKAKNTFLYSNSFKDSLMKCVESPRILLIGGSGLSMGINSEFLSTYSRMNVVNAGVASPIGIVFTMDNSLQFIRSNDIVVLCPEYENFIDRFAYGNSYLVRTLMDTNKLGMLRLRWDQYINILPHVMYYLVTKFKPSEYIYNSNNYVYEMSAFNVYGDMCNHWSIDRVHYNEMVSVNGNINTDMFMIISLYNDSITTIGAHMYLAYPAFQHSSYVASIDIINMVESEYSALGIDVLGDSRRYALPDSMFFDSAYHLTGEGTLFRTRLLLEDLIKIGVI